MNKLKLFYLWSIPVFIIASIILAIRPIGANCTNNEQTFPVTSLGAIIIIFEIIFLIIEIIKKVRTEHYDICNNLCISLMYFCLISYFIVSIIFASIGINKNNCRLSYIIFLIIIFSQMTIFIIKKSLLRNQYEPPDNQIYI